MNPYQNTKIIAIAIYIAMHPALTKLSIDIAY